MILTNRSLDSSLSLCVDDTVIKQNKCSAKRYMILGEYKVSLRLKININLKLLLLDYLRPCTKIELSTSKSPYL